MAQFDLTRLPAALAEHVSPRARLTFPRQGMTSDVAFAEHEGRSVVVKRCANPLYLDWLRREQRVLRALAPSGLPVPRCIAYAEAEASGATVGWLVMSRLAGGTVFRAVLEASPAERVTLFGQLGALCRRLHTAPVPADLRQDGRWLERQLVAARANLSWCDGTAAGLAELACSLPDPVPEALIHGDLALDNVLVASDGTMSIIDWAGGAAGDPRYDVALALQTKPELELSSAALDAFFAAYASPPLDDATRAWFVRLYDFF